MLSALRTQVPRLSLRQFTTSTPALKSLYVGNLSWGMKEDDLRSAFEEFGEVSQVRIVTDRLSGRSRGFGFVDLVEDSAADVAVEEMNGKEVSGRALTVNAATPREEREPGSFQPRGERRSFGSYNDRRGDGGSGGRGGYNDDRSGRGYGSSRGQNDRRDDRGYRGSSRGGRDE